MKDSCLFKTAYSNEKCVQKVGRTQNQCSDGDLQVEDIGQSATGGNMIQQEGQVAHCCNSNVSYTADCVSMINQSSTEAKSEFKTDSVPDSPRSGDRPLKPPPRRKKNRPIIAKPSEVSAGVHPFTAVESSNVDNPLVGSSFNEKKDCGRQTQVSSELPTTVEVLNGPGAKIDKAASDIPSGNSSAPLATKRKRQAPKYPDNAIASARSKTLIANASAPCVDSSALSSSELHTVGKTSFKSSAVECLGRSLQRQRALLVEGMVVPDWQKTREWSMPRIYHVGLREQHYCCMLQVCKDQRMLLIVANDL